MTTLPAAVTIGDQLGPWKLERQIGWGAMGFVYLASRNDGAVEQTAAIKIIRDESEGDAADEAAILAGLRHLNIAQCFGGDIIRDGVRYVAMEYVDGSPITVYAEHRRLSRFERVDLFLGACRAIEHAHHHLVLHLDLKPANILVTRDGAVKVIDFGIARQLSRSDADLANGAGSQRYASPEQLQPGGKVGFSSDVYGLGAVLAELLFAPSVPPEGWICGLDRVCRCATNPNPARRYQCIDDLRSDLDRVLKGQKPRCARSGLRWRGILQKMRYSPVPLAAALAVVAAVYVCSVAPWIFVEATKAYKESQVRLERCSTSGLDSIRNLESGAAGPARSTIEAIWKVSADPPPAPAADPFRARYYSMPEILRRKIQ